MNAEIQTTPLQISDGYRSTRTISTVVCAISFAWSAAQIDLKVINLELLGSVDLSGASIALVFFVGIAYLFIRCALEFAMQSLEVRRWRPAQLDFVLALNAFRLSTLMLGVSGLSRSLNAVAYTIVLTVGVLGAFVLLLFVGVAILTPILLLANRPGRKKSVASAVGSALAWAELLVIIVTIAAFAGLGVASVYSDAVRSYWPIPPDPMALIFLFTAVVLVLCSLVLEKALFDWLFATPPRYTETLLPCGSVRRTYHVTTAPVWDWSSEPTTQLRKIQVRKVQNIRRPKVR